MTKPDEYTIHEVIQKIESGEIKIPIFQRRYVWNKEQVENLFSTVFNDNPFGAISAIKTTDDYPIFASRTFFEDLKDKFQLSEYNDGQSHDKNNPLYLILDGQQRLQSFYLGLTYKFYDMELCFNKHDGTFKYFDEYDKNKFISVKQLYKKLENNTYESVAKSFNTDNNKFVNKNIFKFYYHFFFQKRIVMLLAYPGKIEEKEDKKKFIELFKRLNTGGINLSLYDICESKLKAFNPLWEDLFVKLEKYFEKIKYYTYDMPFRKLDDNDIIIQLKNEGYHFYHNNKNYVHELWIKIICCCFNINSYENILEKAMDIVVSNTEKEFNEDMFFNFICKFFWFYRIINLPKYIDFFLIKDMFIAFSKDGGNVLWDSFLIKYLQKQFRDVFYDEKSLQLFVLKYLLYVFSNAENTYQDKYIFLGKVKDNSVYEIQMQIDNKKDLVEFYIDYEDFEIKNSDIQNFKLKYDDELVDNTLEELQKNFSCVWQKRVGQREKEWNNIVSN